VSSSTVGRKLGFWPFLTFSTISAQRNNSWCYRWYRTRRTVL
jgi:hypothetical protein